MNDIDTQNPIEKQGRNAETIQKQNRLLVLRNVKEQNVTSRIDIAHATGLKQATITNIVNDLISMDYLVETGLIEGKNGRRVTGISLNRDKMRIITVRITDCYFATGIYDVDGICIEIQKEFTDTYKDFTHTLERINEILTAYIDANEGRQILGIGIVLDGFTGAVWETYLKYGDTEDVPLKQMLEAKFGIPVYVDKASNMAGFYEWEKTEYKQRMGTIFCLMVSYSVDSAIITRGRIVHGRQAFFGDFGHVSINFDGPLCSCGNRGCINKYISIDAVREMISNKKSKYPKTRLDEHMNIREIIKAYYENEPLAMEIYREIAHYMGIVIANQINFIEPNEVIFGDEIPNDEQFVEWVRSEVYAILPKGKADDVRIKAFIEPRMTQNDVSLKGMCRYIIKSQLKKMELA